MSNHSIKKNSRAVDPSNHLSDEKLAGLIQGQEFDIANDTQRLHFDDCSQCQERIEELAADGWLWENSKAIVKSTFQLVAEENSSRLDRKTKSFVDVDELLDRPMHPEMLGRLGHYEIESVIGQGGMGIVFKGLDTELRRPVAIKMLLPHLANQGGARQRFLREARSAAAISHSSIVEIHQVRSDAKHPYLVMTLVSGDSLQTTVDRDGPLPAMDIVSFGLQVAEGLAAAHELGLVHRDIKPANVLLKKDGKRVFITDFGLAKTADEASLTCTGLVAGTPHYMSPEQCHGQRTDSGSDLFGLGCLLYFLATGRPPFRGENAMAVMNRICTASPKWVRDPNPEIPKPLARIIHRLLEKRPTDRFSSAAETVNVLKALLSHLQQPDINPAPHVKLASPKLRELRRRLPLALVVLAGFVGLVFFVANQMSQRASDRLEDSQVVTDYTLDDFLSNVEETIDPSMPVVYTAAELKIKNYNKLLTDLKERYNEDHQLVGRVQLSIGRTLVDIEDWQGAEKAFAEAVRVLAIHEPERSEELLRSSLWQMIVQTRLKNYSFRDELDRIKLLDANSPLPADMQFAIKDLDAALENANSDPRD